ncbi:MAG: hypothetical protein C0490_23045 [Marivirga sp.]|nr:hypothetical protein [Marivirga sp.]
MGHKIAICPALRKNWIFATYLSSFMHLPLPPVQIMADNGRQTLTKYDWNSRIFIFKIIS